MAVGSRKHVASCRKEKTYHCQKRQEFISILHELVIHSDHLTADIAFTAIYHMSEQHDLTTYNASYLELALRENVPLASKDHALLAAAKACNVPTLGY